MKIIFPNKKEQFFYTRDQYDSWIQNNQDKKHEVRYLKGLGSSTAKDFELYFKDMDKNLIQLKVETPQDLDIIDLVFGKESGAADRRKTWLNIEL